MVRKIRCHAFVSHSEVIVNAIVTYDADTMALVEAAPFESETAATADFDGIAVAGRADNDIAGLLTNIDRSHFSRSLRGVMKHLRPSTVIELIPLRK